MQGIGVSFRGTYRFLSNFYNFETPMRKVIYSNTQPHILHFKSVESFYMAMKTTNPLLRVKISSASGAEAKRLGKLLDIREDWDDIKEDVMLYALRYKFSTLNPQLRQKLINTGDSYLQEGNWWNDKYWGVCLKTCEGLNRLGCLLMDVRGEINELAN